MDLNSLNAIDLTEANIGTFLTEFENALASEDYAKVKKAIEQINTFIVTPGVINVTRDGNNMMDVTSGGTTESIDIEGISHAITQRVKNDYASHNLTDATKIAAREDAKKEMNKFLTSMFNQENLMEELINRGFSIDEFNRQIDRLNDESKVTIDALKNEHEAKAKAFDDIFGADSKIKTGDYLSKTYPTRLKDCKETITAITIAEKEFNRLEAAINARSTETNPVKQQALDNKITAHKNNLKMLGKKVSDLNIRGMDNNFFVDWEIDTNRSSRMTALASVKSIAENELDNTYDELKDRVLKLSTSEKNKLGITAAIEAEFAKVDDVDPTIKSNARKAVDRYLDEKQKEINSDIPGKIKMEERMIELRTENKQQFKDMADKIQDVKSRIDYKKIDSEVFLDQAGNPVQDVNPDGSPMVDVNGNPVYIRTKYVQLIDSSTGLPVFEGTPPAPKFEIDPATGNPREVEAYATRDKRVIDHVTGQYSRNPDGSFVIEMDGMGNPVQEIVFDEVSDTNVRDYYLQKAGYNKEQALQQIDQLYSRKDMRFALKAEGIGNPITRFFAPKKLWQRSRSRSNFLRNYENGLIELEERKEYEEVIPMKREINGLSRIFERAKNSAIVQHLLYSAGKEQGDDPSSIDKTGLIDNLERAAYEEAINRGAHIGADEITEIRKKKGDTHENLVKRHTKGTQAPANDIIHRDDNNDLEL